MEENALHKPHYEVVAAVITHLGKTFCVQRGRTKYEYTSYKFEFPGGKIEPGETEAEALVREIREELMADISADSKLGTVHHEYPDFEVTLHFWQCSLQRGTLTLTEHAQGQWLTSGQMKEIDWVEADKKFIYGINNR